MDQKRAMLYPEIDPYNATARNLEQRNSASAAMGLPIEAPPSYDIAISAASSSQDSTTGGGWAMPSAPEPQTTTHFAPALPVIVEQPTIATLPQPQTQPQPLPQRPQQEIPTVVRSAAALKLGPNPCAVLCPVCGAHKVTRMTHTPNNRTHLCALILCLVGWCCCACSVPYCMNSCRTGNHYCSNCNTFLGTFRPRRHK